MNFPTDGNAALISCFGQPVTFEPGTQDLAVVVIFDISQYIDPERGVTQKEITITTDPDDRYIDNSRWQVGTTLYRQQGPQMTDGSGLSEIALVSV